MMVAARHGHQEVLDALISLGGQVGIQVNALHPFFLSIHILLCLNDKSSATMPYSYWDVLEGIIVLRIGLGAERGDIRHRLWTFFIFKQ